MADSPKEKFYMISAPQIQALITMILKINNLDAATKIGLVGELSSLQQVEMTSKLKEPEKLTAVKKPKDEKSKEA